MWRVLGAKRDSGKEVHINVDATDAESAEQIACDQGILVSEVTPILNYGRRSNNSKQSPFANDALRQIAIVVLVISSMIGFHLARYFEMTGFWICVAISIIAVVVVAATNTRLPKFNRDGLTTFEMVVKLYCILIGLVFFVSVPLLPTEVEDYMQRIITKDRFKDDNAYGAAANALERMLTLEQKHDALVRQAAQGVCGVLLLILASMFTLRGIMRLRKVAGNAVATDANMTPRVATIETQ